jgi:hypothetical protein
MPPLQDDDKLVRDPNGNPFILYHGTKDSFEVFSDDYLRSMGFHFGCLEQANCFAGLRGHIISVHLLAQQLADIRGSDCGWLHSKATISCLEFHELISHKEAVELLGTDDTSSINTYNCNVQQKKGAISISRLWLCSNKKDMTASSTAIETNRLTEFTAMPILYSTRTRSASSTTASVAGSCCRAVDVI